MHPDDLRVVLINENDNARLSEIPHNLFELTRKRLLEIHHSIRETDDRTGEKIYTLIEDMRAIKENIQDIFRIRERKILELALLQIDGRSLDREEKRRMVPAEMVMFDQIVQSITSCQRELLSTEERGDSIEETGEYESESAGEAGGDAVGAMPSAEDGQAVIRVLTDIEPFMGTDGKKYRLLKGDIITLPKPNADVLCERNIALNMGLNK